MKKVSKSILKKVYKKRKLRSHKGNYGNVLIIAGSNIYSGCAIFNALSAIAVLKSGTDLVEIVSVKRCADIIASYSPDLITIPVEGEYISKKHLKEIFKHSENKDSFLIGAGLGKNKKTLSAVKDFLKKTKLKGVIDADAIHAISHKDKKIDLSNFVITPHSKEFLSLTGKKLSENFTERIKLVEREAKRLNTTILLKGHADIISNGKQTATNKTGNPYMTKGGTGDTLAGILAGLIAQGNDLFDSACAAAYINGKAGELTKKKNSFLASDLVEKIGKVVG